MVILAIDSGIDRTGYSIFEKDKKHKDGHNYVASGLIQTSKAQRSEERLLKIADSVRQLIDLYKPNLMVIEKLFFFKNQKTIVQVSQAQGVVMLEAAKKGLEVEFLTPLEIKQIITGYGQADKKSVQKMLGLTLNLNGELKQDDQADAIACGLAYCFLNKNL